MTIGIDLIPVRPQSSGFRRYAEMLLEVIETLDHYDFKVYYNEEMEEHFSFPDSHIESYSVSTPEKMHFLAGQFVLPYRCHMDGLSLIHTPVSPPPLFASVPTVMTIHDLTFVKYPETMTTLSRWYWKVGMQVGVRVADQIIVPSKSTLDDVTDYYGVSLDRITVIQEVPDNRFLEVEPNQEAIDKMDLPDEFILFVGTVEPRKNIRQLIEAYAIANEKYGVDIPLVITGRLGWLYEDILETVERLGLEDDVQFPGFVTEEKLEQLYANATLFTYLSEYEGFGLPPIEAMASKTPVLVSDQSSLPEVVGDAGETISLENTESIARRIGTLLEDQDYRSALAKSGRQRAEQFTLASFVDSLDQVYEATLGARTATKR